MSHSLLLDPVLAGAVLDVVKGLVFVVFVVSAVFLTVVVLLQEGKGGGLGSAFGGAAADAFGVKAGTVNRFTAWLAACFLGLALLYSGLNAQGDKATTDPLEVPVETDLPPDEPAVSDPDKPADAPADAPEDESPKDADAPGEPDAPSEPEAPDAPEAPKAPGDEGDG